jgi:hypothetical protein
MAATLRYFTFQSVASGSSFLDSQNSSTPAADKIAIGNIAVTDDGTGIGATFGTTEIQGVKKITTLTGVSGITIDAGSQRVANVAAPSAGTDAANKTYVDNAIVGLDWKTSVRASSTTNIATPTTAPGATVGGVSMVANDRFLLTGQTTTSENGIYVWTNATTAARATDAVAGQLTSGAAVFVSEGTNAGTAWTLTTPDPITVGTTGLTWTQFSGAALYTASNGVSLTGKNFAAAVLGSAGTSGTAGGLTTTGGIALSFAATTPCLSLASGLKLDINSTSQTGNAGGLVATASGVALSLAATNSGLNTTSGLAVALVNSDGIVVSTGSTVAANIDTNAGLQFDASSPKKIQVKADGATGGMTVAAAGIQVKPDGTTASTPGPATAGGLGIVANGLAVKMADATLSSSGAFGLKVIGVPSLFTVAGSAVSANVTAANLNTLTGNSDASALHFHTGLAASGVTISGLFSVSSAVAKGDALYVSGAGTVATGDPSNAAKSVIFAVAPAAVPSGATSVQTDGILGTVAASIVGVAVAAGQQIFMKAGGGLTNDPTNATYLPSRSRTIQVGIMTNTTDMMVCIRDYGMKA